MSTVYEAGTMLCSHINNHKPGIASAICHKLCRISTHRPDGLGKGDKDLANIPVGLWHHTHCFFNTQTTHSPGFWRAEKLHYTNEWGT